MSILRVLEIFDSLQGEGVWAGTPMTFVRLAGCNAPDVGLGCLGWCDTPESWDPGAGVGLTPAAVSDRVRLARVCLTGGEPLLQAAAVAELAALLHARGVRVHVETNGTCGAPDGVEFDWVTVSPKPPEYGIVPALSGRVDELKVVVTRADDPAAGVIEGLAESHPRAVVCVQPVAGSEQARRTAIELVMRHPEWRLSLQLHKVLGLP